MRRSRRAAGILGMLITVAVGLGWAAQDPAQIRFSEFFVEKNTTYDLIRPNFRLTYTEKLQRLQGKRVKLVAYMAPIIPYDGSYFMAIKQPFEDCPFCSASFDWASVTTVFMRAGERVRYLGGPVSVEGTLDIGQKKDATGLESWVRITDAVVSRYKE